MKARFPLALTLVYLILIASFIVFIFPFILLLFNAFKTNVQIIDSPLSLPTAIHWDTLKSVVTEMNYLSSLRNTLFLTVSELPLFRSSRL